MVTTKSSSKNCKCNSKEYSWCKNPLTVAFATLATVDCRLQPAQRPCIARGTSFDQPNNHFFLNH